MYTTGAGLATIGGDTGEVQSEEEFGETDTEAEEQVVLLGRALLWLLCESGSLENAGDSE